MAFEQGGMITASLLLCPWPRFCGSPRVVALHDKERILRTKSIPETHWAFCFDARATLHLSVEPTHGRMRVGHSILTNRHSLIYLDLKLIPFYNGILIPINSSIQKIRNISGLHEYVETPTNLPIYNKITLSLRFMFETYMHIAHSKRLLGCVQVPIYAGTG